MKIQICLNSKTPKLFTIMVVCFLLFGCGGDGGNSSSQSIETGTISGSVSGTTIIVVDDNGKIVASDNTKRRMPDLDLDSDDVDESFSFTIDEVPVDTNIRIYLVESTGVFPMYFDDNGTPANVLSLLSAAVIDLGFVDSLDGKAIPFKNPLDTPEISSEGADTVKLTISEAEIDDFVGTWKGDAYYILEDGESGTADVTITLSINGESLDGTFHFHEETGGRIEDWTAKITSTIENGVFSFIMPKPPPLPGQEDDPNYCDNWAVEFTAILLGKHLETMDLNFSGTFCGGTYGNFSDYISKQ